MLSPMIAQRIGYCLLYLGYYLPITLSEARKKMPKIKTKRGAAKRFKLTKKGKIKRKKAYKSHILTKKSAKRKRSLKKPGFVHKTDVKNIRRLIPYG